jgi:hypothetical protein
MEVLSASANDTAAGTGARTVELDMVDGNWVETTVTATLNGVTPVAISGTYVACNAIRVLTTGSGLINAGNLQVRVVSGSAVKRQVGGSTNYPIGDCLYTVPANKVALVTQASASLNSGTNILLYTQLKLNVIDSAGIKRAVAIGGNNLATAVGAAAQIQINCGHGIVVPEKSCVEMAVWHGGSSADAYGQMQLFVIDKEKNGFGI